MPANIAITPADSARNLGVRVIDRLYDVCNLQIELFMFAIWIWIDHLNFLHFVSRKIGVRDDSANEASAEKQKKREVSAIRTILLVSGAYFVAYFPMAILRIVLFASVSGLPVCPGTTWRQDAIPHWHYSYAAVPLPWRQRRRTSTRYYTWARGRNSRLAWWQWCRGWNAAASCGYEESMSPKLCNIAQCQSDVCTGVRTRFMCIASAAP